MDVPMGGRRSRRRFGRRAGLVEVVQLDIEILDINSRKYVAGMHWKPLGQPRNPLREAKLEGQKHGWDVVSIKTGSDWIQAGFVSRAEGAYKGMYSVASALSTVLGSDWCGIFRIGEDRYLISAVDRGGRIVASSDRVLSAESAKALARRIINEEKTPADRIYAPIELEMAERAYTLEELLPADLPKATLKGAQLTYLKFGLAPTTYRNLAVLALMIGATYYAFSLWDQHTASVEAERRAVEDRARQERLAIANANARRQLEAAALAHPWALMPSAEDYVNACESVVDGFPINVAGWSFINASCTDNAVKITYAQGDGTSQSDFSGTIGEALLAYAKESGLPLVSYSESGAKATIAVPLVAPVAGDDPLQLVMDATGDFLGPLQRANSPGVVVFSDITIAEKPVVIKMPPAPAGQPELKAPEATWRQLHFGFKSQIQPKYVFGGMKNRSGLRVTSIDTTLDNGQGTLSWTINGDFYVQR